MQIQRFDFRDLTVSEAVVQAASGSPFRKTREPVKSVVEDVPLPPPPPPTFSEADLKNAEMKGYQRGFQEGIEDGKKQMETVQADIQKKLLENVESFVKHITPLFADYRKMVLDVHEQMPVIALAIAKKVAGAALENNAKAVVEDMAMRGCETLLAEPKLTITVHESMGDMLAKQLENLTSRLQSATDITILRDPDMPQADCRIEWKHGAMERNTQRLLEQTDRVTENMVASAARDTNAHLDTLQAGLPESETLKPKTLETDKE
jgi:flagellar assembly protein FliH